MKTSVMKFPEDAFPGLWIRGEDALNVASVLKKISYTVPDELLTAGVGDPIARLIDWLESCRMDA